MNDSEHPIEIEPVASARPAVLPRWVGWIIAGNPFYIISAALLLFGINRLSVDKSFIPGEESNLVFNFTAIQIYELLLVIVAIILARRRIWYDSTLLVLIENGLVLVPCVLISHAVLIGYNVALPFTFAATFAAIGRYALLKRAAVSFQARLLALGSVVLAINIALPFIFPRLIDKFSEDWIVPGRFCWLFILPAILACSNFLQVPREWSSQPHRQTWLPFLIVGLWVTATGVHFWAVDYIASLPFELELLAPAVWIACWTVNYRLHDFVMAPSAQWRTALVIAPLMTPLLDTSMHYTYLVLTTANLVIYTTAFLRRGSRLAY